MTHTHDEWAWLSPQASKPEGARADPADQELAKSFARTFGQSDGKRVLAHLLNLTKDRALGPETPGTVLRYVEGQRGLVAYMERMIARGRA